MHIKNLNSYVQVFNDNREYKYLIFRN